MGFFVDPPGATTFTRILRGARSAAMARDESAFRGTPG
jgi:hypothetical protein